jgi:hypothetical protein
VIIPFARNRVPPAIALAAAIAGTIAALHYRRLGLTLSHYDARGHLVVARRIIDNITPGWQQIGAVWLPLPHLLNALPVQVDAFYRSGASAVALSIASFAIATGAIAAIVVAITDSPMAAAAGALVFALNPNVLYLQATPMTEPLLMALTTAAVAMLVFPSVVPSVTPSVPVRASRAKATAVVFALACLTRYEAWPVTLAALTGSLWARWRRGQRIEEAIHDVAVLGAYPALAILVFAIFSRVVIGEWLVTGGFFVPENKALGDGLMAAREIVWGLAGVGGTPLVWIGAAGLLGLTWAAVFDRTRADAIAVLSLTATAVVPWAAFYKGHPFRIRYMVPLIAAEAIGCGVAAGMLRRGRVATTAAAAGVIAAALFTLRPLDPSAPMVVEAQWDRPNVSLRARVTACLGSPRPGAKIMASMGSLGHYMQEASGAGYRIRDFLHEGNGDLWLSAVERPRPFADWILIEEKAAGGDMLAGIAREHPHFLDGYSRVCEAAGLALYRRD